MNCPLNGRWDGDSVGGVVFWRNWRGKLRRRVSAAFHGMTIDGRAKYEKQDDGTWKKLDPEPITVALKRLNGSQNMSAEYLNEVFKL